jgi:hypothetical protein
MIPSGLTEEEKNVVQQIQGLIPQIEKDDTLPEDSKNKIYVSCAYEYFNMDWEEEGVKLLKKVDIEYMKNVMGKQMKEDPDFAYLVKKIAMKLIECGQVQVFYTPE